MRVLLLGVGMQGKAALHDLAESPLVSEIVAADKDITALEAHLAAIGYGQKARAEHLDVTNPEALDKLMAQQPAVVVDLLPVAHIDVVATAAVRHGIHLVNTCYTSPVEAALSGEARAKGLTILPEFGFDPGIDLVLLGEAARHLDKVSEFRGYGGGIPEPAAANNPLAYKLTWTFAGVLRSYRRPGRFIEDGEIVTVDDKEAFAPEKIHSLTIEGLGDLEAFPNGDALKYTELLGWERSDLQRAGRFALRWPGHCAFWKKMVDLGFLDEGSIEVDGVAIDRRRYLAALIEPQIQYEVDERDLAIIRIDLVGEKAGEKKRIVVQVVDRRDLKTGHSAMSRTVGYTASIGAQMILDGTIAMRGVLSPVHDVPYAAFVSALAKRGIRVDTEILDL